MIGAKTRTLGPQPGTPAYVALLAERAAKLGLAVVRGMGSARPAEPRSPAVGIVTDAPLEWVPVEEPQVEPAEEPERPATPPGPGLEAGSILGCASGRAHHCR